jgi:hypothetical protein
MCFNRIICFRVLFGSGAQTWQVGGCANGFRRQSTYKTLIHLWQGFQAGDIETTLRLRLLHTNVAREGICGLPGCPFDIATTATLATGRPCALITRPPASLCSFLPVWVRHLLNQSLTKQGIDPLLKPCQRNIQEPADLLLRHRSGAFAEDAQYFRVQCFILRRVQNAVGDREDSTTSNDSVELPVLPEPQRMVVTLYYMHTNECKSPIATM